MKKIMNIIVCAIMALTMVVTTNVKVEATEVPEETVATCVADIVAFLTTENPDDKTQLRFDLDEDTTIWYAFEYISLEELQAELAYYEWMEPEVVAEFWASLEEEGLTIEDIAGWTYTESKMTSHVEWID